MKPFIRTYLCNDENHRFFGEGPRQLLHAIDETGSLRSAALSMNMAYTKALRIIRSAEATLGFPLTIRTTGGKGGGGSQMRYILRPADRALALLREQAAERLGDVTNAHVDLHLSEEEIPAFNRWLMDNQIDILGLVPVGNTLEQTFMQITGGGNVVE